MEHELARCPVWFVDQNGLNKHNEEPDLHMARCFLLAPNSPEFLPCLWETRDKRLKGQVESVMITMQYYKTDTSFKIKGHVYDWFY